SSSKVLFTGYYVPILNGSLVKSDKYPYPLYTLPNDMITLNLGDFKESLKGERIVVRVENNKIKPYYSRMEIDAGAIDGRGLELLWVEDKVEIFFLQIQGSGIIRLEDGKEIYVGYAGTNGKPYKAIGEILIKEGKISADDISMQSIRAYLKTHPAEMDRLMNSNASYVFFTKTDSVAVGAMGQPLVGGRSIATDKEIFPQGVLAYIDTKKPLVAKDGSISQWQQCTRFVLNQDTGGAIKGAARVDVFWGRGAYAETAAGYMKDRGTLYFLVKKVGGS
ncbi:MAG: MltA domain-containing protein, partial [Candidatus Magnetoovum sp. WYHC-5]|nr:MltA domain-containing protein [Candidatus Magnetoovum sp. WYHC-5]